MAETPPSSLPLPFIKNLASSRLFYALWMSDGAKAQQQLAHRLSLIEAPSRREWYGCFWKVLSREWAGIDALRLNKFLLLARLVLRAQIGWIRSTHWGREPSSVLMEMFYREMTSADFALGLKLHILDVLVDELVREGAFEKEEDDKFDRNRTLCFLNHLNKAVLDLVKAPEKSVRARAADVLDDPRADWPSDKESLSEAEAPDWLGFND
ncbi:hypothetical protein L249_8723 [Ophiocordyceps polyrhachis-furcata BCC 54312]|uniref:Uncharacterized protein n=1 Tax=Ophiocordyceps polyrhachis-furcata BCC 54312 TaxID=1330021 RepID=A0A367L7K8_9HYPO|nr:hypothetical protein L249_8723 [Ophiocordyceps polyrhachis-furcata BCC 54312]